MTLTIPAAAVALDMVMIPAMKHSQLLSALTVEQPVMFHLSQGVTDLSIVTTALNNKTGLMIQMTLTIPAAAVPEAVTEAALTIPAKTNHAERI